MSILNQKSIFTSMLQDGPFTVGMEPPLDGSFSQRSRQWVLSLKGDQLIKTKYRAIRSQIFDFLDIDNFQSIQTIIHTPALRKATITRSHQLLNNMFAIGAESPKEIKRYLRDYAHAADDVINSLRSKILAPYRSHVEITNEIETMTEPVELLLLLFDKRYHQKARFEAKRKLVLMGLAASIEQRERETDIEQKFADFLHFLNTFVWSPRLKIGDLEISYLYSHHHRGDFRCSSVEVLNEQEAQSLSLEHGEKLTLIKRRSFTDSNREVPIYVTIRKKQPAAKILKLLRKNQKNPAAAVDDELGLMAVVNSIADVKHFLRHLTRSAVKADSFMTLEDISDTLTGGDYQGTATGSSAKTPMLKFFARLGGMRVEFIIHTNTSYLNYIYQRDVAHDEYEVKRIFDTGVATFLFPQNIYNLNLDEIRTRQLQAARKQIEDVS